MELPLPSFPYRSLGLCTDGLIWGNLLLEELLEWEHEDSALSSVFILSQCQVSCSQLLELLVLLFISRSSTAVRVWLNHLNWYD